MRALSAVAELLVSSLQKKYTSKTIFYNYMYFRSPCDVENSNALYVRPICSKLTYRNFHVFKGWFWSTKWRIV